MKTGRTQFFVISFAFLLIAISAASVSAQWTTVRIQNDAMGHVTSWTEKHRDGRVRMMNRQYFPGTHIINTERTTHSDAGGNITAIIFERRDRLNRVTYISNEYMAGGRMTRGVRQNFSYRDDRDLRGIQNNQQYDKASGRWVRLS